MLFFSFNEFLILINCPDKEKLINNIDSLIIVKNHFYLLKNNIVKYIIPINHSKINKKRKSNIITNCSLFIFLLPEKINNENKNILLNPIKKVISKIPNGNIENNKFSQELLNQIQNNTSQIKFQKIVL